MVLKLVICWPWVKCSKHTDLNGDEKPLKMCKPRPKMFLFFCLCKFKVNFVVLFLLLYPSSLVTVVWGSRAPALITPPEESQRRIRGRGWRENQFDASTNAEEPSTGASRVSYLTKVGKARGDFSTVREVGRTTTCRRITHLCLKGELSKLRLEVGRGSGPICWRMLVQFLMT